ncbi:MAG: hypothetical protein ACIALR_05605, partial [Blastopirellula sp. JB062]
MTHQTRSPLLILFLFITSVCGYSLGHAEETSSVVQTAHFAEMLAGDAPSGLSELRALEKRVQE